MATDRELSIARVVDRIPCPHCDARGWWELDCTVCGGISYVDVHEIRNFILDVFRGCVRWNHEVPAWADCGIYLLEVGSDTHCFYVADRDCAKSVEAIDLDRLYAIWDADTFSIRKTIWNLFTDWFRPKTKIEAA